jgi:hypothetical protein
MSVVVRYNPPSLTTEQYDEADRRLREAGVEALPDGLEYHVCFGSEGNLRVSEIWDTREQFEAYGKRLSTSRTSMVTAGARRFCKRVTQAPVVRSRAA